MAVHSKCSIIQIVKFLSLIYLVSHFILESNECLVEDFQLTFLLYQSNSVLALGLLLTFSNENEAFFDVQHSRVDKLDFVAGQFKL